MPRTFFFRILTISWLVFITFSSLFSFSGMARVPRFNVPHADKFVHFTFYFVLVCIGVLAIREHNKKGFELGKAPLYTLIFAIFYGIIIEVLQASFTTDRHGDIWDVLANTTGALLAFFVVKRLVFKDRSLK